MTDADIFVPSDFDPALLDYLPSDDVPSEYPDPADFEPALPSESHSDDLEAIRIVTEERKQALNKQGVVIQHRARGQKPVFRSSSIPLSSPTPRNQTLPRGSSFWETASTSSPRARSSSPAMTVDERAQRSSPPPAPFDSETAANRQFLTPIASEGDMEQNASNGVRTESAEGTGKPPILSDETPRAPCKPLVPNFNLPLGGNIFSRKFTPVSLAKPLARRGNEPLAGKELLPTLSPESAESPANPLAEQQATPRTDRVLSQTEASSRPDRLALAGRRRTVRIVSSSGRSMDAYQEPERVYSGIRGFSTESEANTARGNFFGLDMHSMLDNIELEKRNVQARLATQTVEVIEKQGEIGVTETGGLPAKRTLLWTEKYRAKKFTDLIGEERTHRHVLHWLKEWDPVVFNTPRPKKTGLDGEEREHRKILMIHGPPGLGKTTLAHVAARQAGYEPYEINASDDRSGGVVKGKIKDILTTQGIKSCGLTSGKKQAASRRPVCLVIDEIDGVTGGGGGGGNEAGFVKALTDLIIADEKAASQPTHSASNTRRKGKKETFRLQRPIIAVCNDLYAPALRALRPMAEIVSIRKPPVGLMIDRLRWVFDKEGFSTEDGAVRRLVELSSMGSAGGNKGDMRGALVSGEWIAARMNREKISSVKKGKGRRLLTRKIVEEEFGGGAIGEGDGKSSSGGRASIKDALDSVFYIEKEKGKRLGTVAAGKKLSAAKLQSLVEGLGEFEKITNDCFGLYPTCHFHDDSLLSKPNAIHDWLYFSDLLSSRVFNEQEYELTPYLSHPILAFHHLFASATSKPQEQNEAVEEAPFAGSHAEWQAREATKENSALISAVHSCLHSTRLAQTFKVPEIIATELAPYLNCMLAPRINPVLIGGSTSYSASVRKDSEKILVSRAVNAMEATGVVFEKIRVEPRPGAGVGNGWAYRMEPAVDALGMYQTLAGTETSPVRYAVRQVLDQELKKSMLLKEKASREARMGKILSEATLPTTERPTTTAKEKKPGKVKRDFFGRLVIEVEGGENEGEDGGKRKKRRKVQEEKDEVWVTFHEGFSNAVRKGIGLDELLDGLV